MQAQVTESKKQANYKDSEFRDLKEKIALTVEKIKGTETEYAQIRQENSEVVRKNKNVKADLAIV